MYILKYIILKMVLMLTVIFQITSTPNFKSGHKWSMKHRVLKFHKSKMNVIYMQSWKQCALRPSCPPHEVRFLGTKYARLYRWWAHGVWLMGTKPWDIVHLSFWGILGMLSHARPSKIPASVNCFYEYLFTQKSYFF